MSDPCAFSPEPSPDVTDRPFWKWAPRHKLSYYVGVDVGQSMDNTAVVVVEKRQLMVVSGHRTTHKAHGAPEYHVVDCGKIPLGTTYPVQAALIKERLEQEPFGGRAEVFYDRSGVGRAFGDELRRLRIPRLTGVTITGGEDEVRDGLDWRVPKVRLVAVVTARMHDGTLKVSEDMPLTAELVKQLSEFQVRYTSSGGMTFAAAGSGHDDLVLALSLALWGASQPSGGRQVVGLRGI